MEGQHGTDAKTLWFALAITVLVIGAAFFLGALFLEALGWTYYAPSVSLLGTLLMVGGGVGSVAAIRI